MDEESVTDAIQEAVTIEGSLPLILFRPSGS